MPHQRYSDPNIVGGKRTVWTPFIVLGSILLAGLVLLFTEFHNAVASAALLVGAGGFFGVSQCPH